MARKRNKIQREIDTIDAEIVTLTAVRDRLAALVAPAPKVTAKPARQARAPKGPTPLIDASTEKAES